MQAFTICFLIVFRTDLFDRCHETLFQYCRFLRQACGSLDDFAKLMPSLKELVTNYHLDIEIAVHLYRPILEEVYMCLCVCALIRYKIALFEF